MQQELGAIFTIGNFSPFEEEMLSCENVISRPFDEYSGSDSDGRKT